MSQSRDPDLASSSVSNVNHLNIFRLGLSSSHQQLFIVKKYYLKLFKKKLTDDVYDELKKTNLPENELQVIIDRMCAKSKELSVEEIRKIFEKIIRDQISQGNIDILLLLQNYRNQAQDLFSDNNTLAKPSFAAWSDLIIFAEKEIEQTQSQWKKMIKNYFAEYLMVPIVAAFAADYLSSDENERAILMQNLKKTIPAVYLMLKMFSFVLSLTDKEAALEKLHQIVKKEFNNRLGFLSMKQKPTSDSPTNTLHGNSEASLSTIEETKAQTKKLKRKHLSGADEKKNLLSSSVKKPPTFVEDKENKTKYFILQFDHKQGCFFKSTWRKLDSMLEDGGIRDKRTRKNLLTKVETQASIGRILPANSDRCGISYVTEEEKEKFSNGMKLRIRADLRLDLATREPTEKEKEMGIDEVISPRTAKFH